MGLISINADLHGHVFDDVEISYGGKKISNIVQMTLWFDSNVGDDVISELKGDLDLGDMK